MPKKIQVSFSDKQIRLLERLKGEFGETDADVVRSVVLGSVEIHRELMTAAQA